MRSPDPKRILPDLSNTFPPQQEILFARSRCQGMSFGFPCNEIQLSSVDWQKKSNPSLVMFSSTETPKLEPDWVSLWNFLKTPSNCWFGFVVWRFGVLFYPQELGVDSQNPQSKPTRPKSPALAAAFGFGSRTPFRAAKKRKTPQGASLKIADRIPSSFSWKKHKALRCWWLM